MSTVGVKALKDRLTHYLRQSKRGEEVVVTERGRPIAVIHPIRAAEPAVRLDARLARLADQGLITLPVAKTSKKVRKIRIAGRPLSRTILDERR
jgi:prevent-host-death family protein